MSKIIATSVQSRQLIKEIAPEDELFCELLEQKFSQVGCHSCHSTNSIEIQKASYNGVL